jgi:hypothetical protein
MSLPRLEYAHLAARGHLALSPPIRPMVYLIERELLRLRYREEAQLENEPLDYSLAIVFRAM